MNQTQNHVFLSTTDEHLDSAVTHELEGLRRLFHRIGKKLMAAGDVIVFINGGVFSVAPTTPPEQLLKLAGRETKQHCLHFVDACTGATSPFDPSKHKLVNGTQLVTTPCITPVDGIGLFDDKIKSDETYLLSAGYKVTVTSSNDGRVVLLVRTIAANGKECVLGTAIPNGYPTTVPDWIVVEKGVTLDGFGGQRRPFGIADGIDLEEISIHPNVPCTASEFILNFLLTRAGKLRK